MSINTKEAHAGFSAEEFNFAVGEFVVKKGKKPLGQNTYGDLVYSGRVASKFKKEGRRGYMVELSRDYNDPNDTPVLVEVYETEIYVPKDSAD